jgi:hypothetical protein
VWGGGGRHGGRRGGDGVALQHMDDTGKAMHDPDWKESGMWLVLTGEEGGGGALA